ncbi:MAG: ATP-binding protein, partial [bacterium]
MADEPLAVRLRAIFAEELEEQLAQMRVTLAVLQRDPADREQLRVIFRVMHTLKGAARAAGVTPIEQVCHALEGDLARARDMATPLAAAQLALLLEAADAFAGAREQLSANQPVDTSALALVLQRARRGGGVAHFTPARASVSAPAVPANEPLVAEEIPAAAIPSPSPAASSSEERVVHRDQVRLGVGEADAITAAAGEIAVLATALADHAMDVRMLRSRLRNEQCGADVVERELAILMRRAGDDARTLAAISGRLDGPLRHLRQRSLRDLTDTMERVARDVARDVGKEIQVVTEGDTIEADRVVIEALREPLLHLIRNAVDHGIESPAARTAAGKAPAGKLRIELAMHGDRLQLTLADDGGGLDLAAIRRAHERRGHAAPTEASALMRTIFDDGFSTRESATTLSGRGVGLGIVRASVERLGGTVDVASVKGQGTTFVIEVPLSIATLRALLVVVGGVIVAIPSTFVNRVSSVRTQKLERVDGRDVMITRGAPVPVIPLATLIGPPYKSAEWGERAQVVMLEAAGQRIAVTVDDMLDERELVMRPLEYVG